MKELKQRSSSKELKQRSSSKGAQAKELKQRSSSKGAKMKELKQRRSLKSIKESKYLEGIHFEREESEPCPVGACLKLDSEVG